MKVFCSLFERKKKRKRTALACDSAASLNKEITDCSPTKFQQVPPEIQPAFPHPSLPQRMLLFTVSPPSREEILQHASHHGMGNGELQPPTWGCPQGQQGSWSPIKSVQPCLILVGLWEGWFSDDLVFTSTIIIFWTRPALDVAL